MSNNESRLLKLAVAYITSDDYAEREAAREQIKKLSEAITPPREQGHRR